MHQAMTRTQSLFRNRCCLVWPGLGQGLDLALPGQGQIALEATGAAPLHRASLQNNIDNLQGHFPTVLFLGCLQAHRDSALGSAFNLSKRFQTQLFRVGCYRCRELLGA